MSENGLKLITHEPWEDAHPGSPEGETELLYSATIEANKAPSDVKNPGGLEDVTMTDSPEEELAVYRVQQKAKIAAARWDTQVGGCEWNGHMLASDREGRSSVDEAYSIAVLAGDNYVSQTWKFLDGFATVNKADLVAMGLAIAAHVQECFDTEGALSAIIDEADTIEDILAVAWP